MLVNNVEVFKTALRGRRGIPSCLEDGGEARLEDTLDTNLKPKPPALN